MSEVAAARASLERLEDKLSGPNQRRMRKRGTRLLGSVIATVTMANDL